MLTTARISTRTRRISAVILCSMAAMEAIPLLFAIRHLDRVLMHPQTLAQILGALAVAGGFIAYSARNPGIRSHLGEHSWVRIPAIAVAILAGIVEEVYFRQLLMNALGTAGVGVVTQIAISGAAFGASHAIWGIGGGRRVLVGAMIATTLLGTGLAILFVAGGRVIVPCIEAHILVDLILEPALVIFAVESASRRRTVAALRGTLPEAVTALG